MSKDISEKYADAIKANAEVAKVNADYCELILDMRNFIRNVKIKDAGDLIRAMEIVKEANRVLGLEEKEHGQS